MPPPRVSVCVDVYNYADFLTTAIESVLTQTLADYELIVVDDCSTDDSYDVALEYAKRDNRVQAHRNTSNLGMIGNRNACLRLARGEYVKFLHADDFLSSTDALSAMTARMDSNPAASLVACSTQFVDAESNVTGGSRSSFSTSRFIAGTTVITRCLAERKNLVGGPSAAMFRRGRALRGFDERYFHAADLEMWFHLLEQGCFGYLNEPLVAYRWHGRQQTEKDRATLSQANDQRNMLAAYLDKPYIRLHRQQKEALVHDALRQTLRRCGKIGERETASQLICEYGAGRYYAKYPLYSLLRTVAKHVQKWTDPLPSVSSGDPASHPLHPRGINVAGFLRGQYGIGESSRAFCRAVTETGIPYALVNIESRDHSNRDDSVTKLSRENSYGVNLMTFSFDYARRFYRDRRARFFEGRRNIAVWYWELEKFPARWHSSFDYYDEVWVPSAFCEKALSAVSPIPIRKVTYPLYTEQKVARDRSAFGLNESDYVFLFSFDFFSTAERKNPLGLIAAFREAFDPAERVTLVLKSINSHHDPQNRLLIEEAAAGLKVVWIEAHLSGAQMSSLFAAADCYVSLHRSEGLGLGMAQAMSMAMPVIATGYSGNLEFMNRENSLLVKYDMVEIREDCGTSGRPPSYTRGSLWADPDIADAARLMRWIADHREEGARIGDRGRREILAALDPERTRSEIRDRMGEIYGDA